MKNIYLICLIIFLTGCSSTKNSEKKNSVNLVELENRAESAYIAGHLDMAEGLYRTLIKNKDNYAPAWFRLGNIYTRSARLDAAISAYQHCIQLDPEHNKAWYNLAIARMRQSTDVLIEAQKHVDPKSPVKIQMDELFLQLMRLQTGEKNTGM
ncbi:tetratricopeptide repeat protein [Pseudoalteromonas sp. TB64]|uniref:tetratricopeptide repeat protein n=1 Tax=Pseudoalteromonas sp. TB64 TaxID=1938600 RepID=UPI0004665760|nr:tetratricopeptide repeat protein [Pseudoalteromonas sp. TB64]